ncbi:ABC transporter substrate-binding protein [Paenibacillus cremeus]|uniref:Extracellular solute-binding protein n=1 Tax=Paenibacillus cremeus TaxID=2163881 RepID=A0A559JVV3_9BACL|nr:extracellular solute-binding protein [Paenibacillus cremeus]TVY03998.1 extracellular solute-binding protein [Paenibacillus cremeus]
MNSTKKIVLPLSVLMLLSSTLAACSKAPAPASAPAEADYMKKPVTLVFKSQFDDSMEKFNERYGDRIRAKFPNVTVKFLPREKDLDILNLVASGTYPDIMYGNTSQIDQFLIGTGLAYDMSELIKKDNYDISRFEPALMDNLRNVTPAGTLYGLPMPWAGAQVLYYNKALFDRFGVPYPKDGMTWDEVYELAKKMTRNTGDQQYRGFSSFISAVLRDNQISLPYLDPKVDKMADSDQWKRLFSNLSRFYEIAGNNRDTKSRSQTIEEQAFMKGNVAMAINQFNKFPSFPPDLDWDMVSMPQFPGSPKVGSQAGSNYWFITKTNENKEISFQIIKYLLSDELQLEAAKKDATLPSLKKGAVNLEVLGQDVPALKGKHVQAVYNDPPAPAMPRREPNLKGADPNVLKTTMEEAFNRVVIDKIDINTALREASEKMDKAVAEKNNSEGKK